MLSNKVGIRQVRLAVQGEREEPSSSRLVKMVYNIHLCKS